MAIFTEEEGIFDGTSGADSVLVLARNATANGLGGDDWLASSNFYTLTGGEEQTFFSGLSGDAGDDHLQATFVLPVDGEGFATVNAGLYGGEGDDDLWIDAATDDATLVAGVDGGDGADTIHISLERATETAIGTEGTAVVFAGAGDDAIFVVNDSPASSGTLVYGGEGDDRMDIRAVSEQAVAVTAYGEAGADTIRVRMSSPDALADIYGGGGDDRLTVSGGSGNLLVGNQGDDTLTGGGFEDRMIGGQGDDLLRGRGGFDDFVFQSIRAGERDRISDFVIGEDSFDLQQIDANVFRSGGQAFIVDGSEGTGRAWFEEDPDSAGTILYADTGRQILEVALLDGGGVRADDYGPNDFFGIVS
jgi:Ca2+-binding RTX toxin-like protein